MAGFAYGKGSQGKGCEPSLDAGRGKKTDSPLRAFRKECQYCEF